MFKVLIVDDEETVRTVLGRLLERAGFAVAVHDSALRFDAAVRLHAPDVVVLDLSFPGMSGDEALSTGPVLDELWSRGVPVIVVSGLDPREVARRARKINAAATLMKPVNPGALVETVNSVLGDEPTPEHGTQMLH